MQTKWHSSGLFSCNSLSQNMLVFLPVGLGYINSNTSRLIWWQRKTDTGGESRDHFVTRQLSPLCLSSLSSFSLILNKVFMSLDTYPYIQGYIRKIGKYACVCSLHDIYHVFLLKLDILSWLCMHTGSLCIQVLSVYV